MRGSGRRRAREPHGNRPEAGEQRVAALNVQAIVIRRQEVRPMNAVSNGRSPAVHDRATAVVATGSARQASRERRLP